MPASRSSEREDEILGNRAGLEHQRAGVATVFHHHLGNLSSLSQTLAAPSGRLPVFLGWGGAGLEWDKARVYCCQRKGKPIYKRRPKELFLVSLEKHTSVRI